MQSKQSNDNQELIHELWLIYAQLKDAEESDSTELVSSARERLGRVVNALNQQSAESNSPVS